MRARAGACVVAVLNITSCKGSDAAVDARSDSGDDAGAPDASRDGGGGPRSRVLTAGDLAYLGAFRPANPAGDSIDGGRAGALAVRRINGKTLLYSAGDLGKVVEYEPLADDALAVSPPFAQSAATKTFDDIFQNELFQHARDVNGNEDVGGLAFLRPQSLFWDEIGQRMYWTHVVTYEPGIATYDTGIGRGTINRAAGTGKGEGMWALSQRPATGETVTDATVDVGNRWITGVMAIPPAFAAAYTGGKRLAAGAGNPAVSIASVGPIGMGLSLYAFDPANLTAATNHNVAPGSGSSLVKLAAHPFVGLSGATPPYPQTRGPVSSKLQMLVGDHDDFFPAATNNITWTDVCGAASWIEAGEKSAVVLPCSLSSGNAHSIVQASPAPTPTSFAVADLGDTQIDDEIFVKTNETAGNSTYPWSYGIVTGISGNQVTCAAGFKDAQVTLSGPMTPTVGGWYHAGSRYIGGGSHASRRNAVLFVFDPADLAKVAQGTMPASAVNPVEAIVLTMAGTTQPFHEGAVQFASAYDADTRRLYIFSRWLYSPARNEVQNLVHVYQIGK